ncbi:MAG: SH3 domain-containing protein [Candidatus Ventricola sp.]
MKKTACLFLILTLLAATALGETLYVDNRETDKVYPERLNLRAEPSKNGAILGMYYTGAEVESLGAQNDSYTRVRIGGMDGYMATEYLVTLEEAERRYGADSGFTDCRSAEVDLAGMWMQAVPLLANTDLQAEAYGQLAHGAQVRLIGVLDTWAYIAAQVDGERKLGYVPLDVLTDVGAYKVCIVAGKKADSRTILYDAPNAKGKPIMALKNGAACLNLFGRREGEWRRVRVGGVSGWIKYTQTGSLVALGDQERTAVPYYPLLMQARTDALLYSSPEGDSYMTLGKDMKVEVLAESDTHVYVRTLEGGVGAVDCGDFGYMSLADLTLSQADTSVGVAQVDDGDLPLVLLDAPDAQADMLGALCGGAQVRVLDYTQTDYVQVALGAVKGYLPKQGIRILTHEGDAVSDRIPQRALAREDTALRDEPSQSAEPGDPVKQGERVYMLGVLGDWAFVQASVSAGLNPESEAGDHTGFVPLSALNTPDSTTHLTAYVNTDKVNLRSKPSGTEGQIIGKARTGERLRVADYGAQWTLVVTPDGVRGYVMTKYLDFE